MAVKEHDTAKALLRRARMDAGPTEADSAAVLHGKDYRSILERELGVKYNVFEKLMVLASRDREEAVSADRTGPQPPVRGSLSASQTRSYTLDGVYRLLHRLGYSWLAPRPQHERADPDPRRFVREPTGSAESR